MNSVCTLGDFCEGLGLPRTSVPELMKCLEARELAEISRERSLGLKPRQALPLLEEGHEFGRVEARIPRSVFFRLMQRKNFGWEGLMSEEGLKDICKELPECRVETVSGKVTSGWTGGRKTVKRYG